MNGIRPAQLTDAAAIEAIIQPYIDDFAVDNMGRQCLNYQSILKVLGLADVEYFVYSDAELIIGAIAYQKPAHLLHFFVDQRYQHQGVGKKMWQFVENKIRAENILAVTVNSSCYAEKIYQHFGFMPTQSVIEDRGLRFIPMKKTYLSNNT
ncbi:GNAT family N-acetyltransferase [Acinetobacter qingfengensis]|uniref:N-acetyltransferase domain-containing protein n=2 Tax=Acinetobacter qingfengensis TaxID=1262585 RepID=A0A1E7RCE6_9GAMM|nr:GNAT family N-acetyltransferase [Acinetobacter qingfengensis]OEY97044.1 hypothetical protein BJI46_10945 [Acinetobacter qingfengensis]